MCLIKNDQELTCFFHLVLSSTGISVRTRRSKNSVNQSRRSGCSLGTCTVHDLAHRLHQLNNKLKVSSAPIDKISPLGYGRRRRSVPETQMRLQMQGGRMQPVWRLHKLEALLRRTWAGRQPRGPDRRDFSRQVAETEPWLTEAQKKKTQLFHKALWMRDRKRGVLWWSTATFWLGVQVYDSCTDPWRSEMEQSEQELRPKNEPPRTWQNVAAPQVDYSVGLWDSNAFRVHTVLSREKKQKAKKNKNKTQFWTLLHCIQQEKRRSKQFGEYKHGHETVFCLFCYFGHCMRNECFRFLYQTPFLVRKKDCYATWTLLLLL